MAQYHYSFIDRSGELSSVTIPVEEPSEAELDWETIINADEGGFRTALEAVTLANLVSHHVLVSQESLSPGVPTSPWANRETGLRIFYEGVTSGDKRNFTVPAPDLDNLTLQEGSDLVVLDDGGIMAALVTEIEAHLLLPYGDADEAVTVTRAVVVGRNN